LFYLEEKNVATIDSYVCPACANSVNTAAYIYRDSSQSEEAHILRCQNCTIMFARPILIPELADRQMDSLDDAEMYGSQVMKTLHEQLYIKKEIRLIKKAGLAGGNLLDVGCGAGWISNIWAQNGFQVTGLEPSLARCNFAREKYGLNVVNEYIENTEFDRCFDVSILRHVIEHFQDPGVVLRKIHGTLKKDGVVMVIVPNIDSIGRYLFGVGWEWVLPWHCNFFNKRSLETLLEESGFEIIKTYQTASPFYYFESMARKFDSKFLNSINNRFKVASMLTTAPVAITGLALGLGDNLTTLARVRK
jgi:2-polyprenyl-3-methyl-5-hydroxy-6-metoxy-1,4-benzoquinol methylase